MAANPVEPPFSAMFNQPNTTPDQRNPNARLAQNARPRPPNPPPAAYTPPMKFGRIKRQHGRVGGLDAILNRIIRDCPHVTRIVPGRIKVRRGKTPPSFKVQYPTDAGLKCLYTGTGTVQEVFLICSDSEKTKQWLVDEEIVEKQADK